MHKFYARADKRNKKSSKRRKKKSYSTVLQLFRRKIYKLKNEMLDFNHHPPTSSAGIPFCMNLKTFEYASSLQYVLPTSLTSFNFSMTYTGISTS